MAFGELNLTGDEVVTALTRCDAATRYTTVLNEDGERLAELLAARVLAILQAKLAAHGEENS